MTSNVLTPLALTYADILRHLQAGDVDNTATSIAKATGRDKSNTRRDLGKLEEAGLVIAMSGEPARYIIANPIRAGLVEKARNYSHWDAIWLS